MSFLGELRTAAVQRLWPALPERFRRQVLSVRHSWNCAETRKIARAEKSDVGLLIAPANYASQAYYWARAAETLPGVSARNLVIGYNKTGFSREPDVAVSPGVALHSRVWARRQRRAILRSFTHVLYEAEIPLLPSLYGGDIVAEIRDLQAHGVKVAMLSHGSDTRTPSEHAKTHPHSPFHDDLDGLTRTLERVTADNRAVLEALGTPKFVSGPDLLNYVPDAVWLPTLTDAEKWRRLPPAQLGKRKLTVLHVPSRSALKGTVHVRKAMERLREEGLVEYIEAENVPYDEMPRFVGRADLVVDQLSIGMYGVTSVEAMLAGRLVVAEVGDDVRHHMREETRRDLPIIQANPDTIYQVVKNIAQSPEDYRAKMAEGRAFAEEVHSCDRAAGVLRGFLLGRG